MLLPPPAALLPKRMLLPRARRRRTPWQVPLLRRRLRAIDTRWGADGEAVVRDVRGMGCMVGLELHERFAPGSSKALAQACGARGLLLLNCSVYETVRFIPPLTVSEAEIEEATDIFARTLNEIVQAPAHAGDRPTMSMS